MITTAIEAPYGGSNGGWFALKQGGGGFTATILVTQDTYRKAGTVIEVVKRTIAGIPLGVTVRIFSEERCKEWLHEQGVEETE